MVNSTVSIAMCTYNGASFLREQLDSFTAQTRLPDEVVVCDDGSTDDTLRILDDWQQNVPFTVKIIRNEINLGTTRNFEKAVSLCTRDIIFLSDQDDIWKPQKIQRMCNVFDTRPEVGLVYCDADCIDQKGRPLAIRRSSISFADIINVHFAIRTPYFKKHPNPAGCCGAFRASFVPQILPFMEIWGHDLSIYLKLPAFTQAATLQEPLFFCRLHDSSASAQGSWKEKYEAHRERMLSHYKWSVGAYFFLEKEIDSQIEWLDSLPEMDGKNLYLRFLRGNRKHYTNRSRVQRNIFVFFPLFIEEVVSGRYFERFQPVKSMLYDFGMGFYHGCNPVETFRLIKNIMGKMFHRGK